MSEAWKRNLAVPFFSQRENTYVWYQVPDKDIPDKITGKILHKKGEKIEPGISMAYCSCNITSLCMILHYFGITEDSPDDMMRKVFEIYFKQWAQEENGKYDSKTGQKQGTSRLEYTRNMRDITNILYGVSSNQMSIVSLSLDRSKKYIAAGIRYGFPMGH